MRFEALTEEQKKTVREAYENGDFETIDALFKKAGVYTPGTCNGCPRRKLVMLWIEWAIAEKKV